MANEVGRLFVSMGLNSSDFHKKLTAAEKAAERQARSMQREFVNMVKPVQQAFALVSAAALASTAAIGIMVKKTAEFADNMDDAAKRTGIAVERLQTLNYAAKQTGTSLESFEKGMKILSNNLLDASRNMGTAKDTFKELNIAVKNSDGTLRKTTDVFSEAADKISMMKDETRQAAYANDLFGKSGTMLLPLLKMGATGIAELEGNLKKYGYVMSSKEITAGETFNDNLLTMQMAIEGLTMRFSSKLIPVLDETLVKTLDWVASNKELINQKMDSVVEKIGNGFKLIADNKDAIISVFSVVALASETIMRAASGWGMIISGLSGLGKIKIPGSGGSGFGMQQGLGGGYFQAKAAGMQARILPSNSTGLKMILPASGGSVSSAGGSSGSGGSVGSSGFRVSRFGLNPYGGDVNISGSMPGYSSGQLSLNTGHGDLLAGFQDSKFMSSIEEHNKKVEIMRDRWAALGDTMSNVLANSVMQSGNAFKNIADGFTRMLETMALQLASKAAVFGILNLFTGGTFGAGKSVLDFAFGGFRANGGSVQSGRAYIVGERGPEIFTPTGAGKITPNSQINDHSSLTIQFNNSEKDEMTRMSDIQLAERIKKVSRNFNLQVAY